MIIDFGPLPLYHLPWDSTLLSSMGQTPLRYGEEIWVFRERIDGHPTTKATNRYEGEKRGYVTKPK